MGCSSSKPALVSDILGDGKAFLDKYAVDHVLGEGEFGVVKLIHEKQQDGSDGPPLACKMLRKGAQFKHNTLYSAIKPKVLKLECKILRTLAGKHFNVGLVGVYESPSMIYAVTEFCEGGDMYKYVADAYHEDGLRTEDISRISFQLFDAVAHCAKYGIIHRDIKPENIMFASKNKGAPLKLIDFGSGTMDSDEEVIEESAPTTCEQADGNILRQFTTFAGSAFYISPEMFQRKYTCKTDVWSAGVTIFVIVAGYPSMALQAAFNQLQNHKEPENRVEQLKQLPNMPEMPDDFFDMLSCALVYRHKQRNDARSILDCEFIKMHKSMNVSRRESTIVAGATFRHIQMREYQQFERTISTLLATVLSRSLLRKVLKSIDALIAASPEDHFEESAMRLEATANKERLQVITVQELYSILQALGQEEVIHLCKEHAKNDTYEKYAYHVAKLRQFYTYQDIDLDPESRPTSPAENPVSAKDVDDSRGRKLKKIMEKRSKRDGLIDETQDTNKNSDLDLDDTQHSIGKPKGLPQHSVHEGNLWDTIRKALDKAPNQASGMTRVNSTPGGLNKLG